MWVYCGMCETGEDFPVVNMSPAMRILVEGVCGFGGQEGEGGFKGSASQAAPDSHHSRSRECSWLEVA